jgi:hypothetical protein
MTELPEYPPIFDPDTVIPVIWMVGTYLLVGVLILILVVVATAVPFALLRIARGAINGFLGPTTPSVAIDDRIEAGAQKRAELVNKTGHELYEDWDEQTWRGTRFRA